MITDPESMLLVLESAREQDKYLPILGGLVLYERGDEARFEGIQSYTEAIADGVERQAFSITVDEAELLLRVLRNEHEYAGYLIGHARENRLSQQEVASIEMNTESRDTHAARIEQKIVNLRVVRGMYNPNAAATVRTAGVDAKRLSREMAERRVLRSAHEVLNEAA